MIEMTDLKNFFPITLHIKKVVLFQAGADRASGCSVGCVSGCHAGGREFDSGGTNTQGLKTTKEEVLPL